MATQTLDEMLGLAGHVNLPCVLVFTELTLNPPEGIVAGEQLSRVCTAKL